MREESYDIGGYQRLAVAVVKQAVTDYEIALKKLKRNRKDIWASQMRNDCERFLKTKYQCIQILMGKRL